jgi:hypothetical protein
LRFVRDTRGVELITLDPEYPISDNNLVAMIEDAIVIEETKTGVTGGKIKMAVVDVISSMPGVRVPFERIIKLLREHNILSLIDGAHAIGKWDYVRLVFYSESLMLTFFLIHSFVCFCSIAIKVKSH